MYVFFFFCVLLHLGGAWPPSRVLLSFVGFLFPLVCPFIPFCSSVAVMTSRRSGLAVMGCSSGLTRVGASAGLGGFDSCGLGLGAVGRSRARWRVCWRRLASGLLGVLWAGLGVAPRGAGWLGLGVRWCRRWLGGQARRAVWRAGLLGCCGCCWCRCADACGVAGGGVCAGLGLG